MSGNPPASRCCWPGCEKPPQRFSRFCPCDTSRLQALYGTTAVTTLQLVVAPDRWAARQRIRKWHRPAVGWVEDQELPQSPDEVIADLRAKVAELEIALAKARAGLWRPQPTGSLV